MAMLVTGCATPTSANFFARNRKAANFEASSLARTNKLSSSKGKPLARSTTLPCIDSPPDGCELNISSSTESWPSCGPVLDQESSRASISSNAKRERKVVYSSFRKEVLKKIFLKRTLSKSKTSKKVTLDDGSSFDGDVVKRKAEKLVPRTSWRAKETVSDNNNEVLASTMLLGGGGGGCFVNTATTTIHHQHHHRNNNHKQYELVAQPSSSPHHLHRPKAPSAPLLPTASAPPESFTERFSTMLDQCQRKIRLLQAPTALFSSLVMKARRKDKDAPAAEQEHKLYLEDSVLERKIPETDLRQLVELPAGLGYHEWLASHTIDFFQHINLVYGTIAEFCTLSGCSDMSGPCTRPYLWFDEKGKKVRVAAPQYIDYVMTFTQKTINDETIFPTKFENEFPGSFESIVKKIHRLLFHVIAHLYHSHFRELVVLSLHAHLNCIFAHFTLFNERFSLIDEKETEILHDLVLALRLHPSEGGSKEPEEDSTDVNDEDPSEDGPEEPQNSSVPGHADPNTSNSLVQSGAKSAATSSSNNSAPFLSPENSSSTTAAKP